jgi:meiosis-specific APC/C activator protein AMA1
MGRFRRWRAIGNSDMATIGLSPADSGYHSLEESPTQHCGYFDGPGSSDDGESYVPEPNRSEWPREFATPRRVPLLTAKSTTSIPSLFSTETRLHAKNRVARSQSLPRRTSSIRTPDRFVPTRTRSTSLSERFRTTKLVDDLSPDEKLLRHNGATPDAFCFRRRAIVPMASEFRAVSSESGVFRMAGTVLSPLPDNQGGPRERQVSHGTVWAVGGVAPSGTAVDDGRGRLVQSGTSARLFTTNFSIARPKMEEELEKHDGRLACALDINRVQRILDFDISSTFPQSRGKKSMRQSLQDLKTAWNGTEWVKWGSSQSE